MSEANEPVSEQSERASGRVSVKTSGTSESEERTGINSTLYIIHTKSVIFFAPSLNCDFERRNPVIAVARIRKWTGPETIFNSGFGSFCLSRFQLKTFIRKRFD